MRMNETQTGCLSTATCLPTAIGLDLGSRRSKAVVVRDGKIIEQAVFGTFALDRGTLAEWLTVMRGRYTAAAVGTTGYGRHVGAERFSGSALTEIRAFARGAAVLAPHARTIVDIGGQDAKVINLDDTGAVLDFAMNDRCAAGTGKFFEMVANTLGLSLSELIAAALTAPMATPVSATCAVFAESEIIGQLAEGVAPASLARGVFQAVAGRLAAMLERLRGIPPVILVGGGANACLAQELSDLIGETVELPSSGSFFGAMGAAMFVLSAEKGVEE